LATGVVERLSGLQGVEITKNWLDN
jgi:hypothetical protein